MSTFPTSPRSALLAWAELRAPAWSSNAAAIGLSPALAATYAAAVTAYANAASAQAAAIEAARIATAVASETFAELRTLTGDRVRAIRGFAENQPKPSVVYNLAQIPAPAAATPAPPPAQPTDLRVSIIPESGALELKWKATNPAGTQGTSYIVRRRMQGQSDFMFVGVTGAKRYVDNTFFAGPDSVEYTVQGQRADSAGPLSAIFVVQFGRQPGAAGQTGAMTVASVTAVEAPKQEAAA